MRHLRSAALVGVIGATAAISPAVAGPFTPLTLLTTIAIPSAGDTINPNPGGAFTAFDISFFDPATRRDYVADRSNAAVDVFAGNMFLGRVPGFAGQQKHTSTSGPDGVLTVSNPTQHTLFAGDAGSLLRTYNITGTALPPPTQFPPINTGGTFRVDEMAYSPSANLVLVANNADTPAFGTLVNASTGAIVHGHIVVPGAVGLEQSVWNPNTGSFFISVPQLGAAGNPGGVAEIKTDGTIGKIINFANLGIASCSPTGLVLGKSGNLMVGCGNKGTQTVVLDPSGTGSIVKTLTQISGSDELWYDPKTNDYYVTGVNSSGGRVFDIVNDMTLSILQSVSLPDVNAHSIAVDPGNGFVYVPLEGSTSAGVNPLCPLGCVAVYGVPEPGSLPLLLAGLTALVGLELRRRARSE
ncbi:MAG: PEP-CTERM sorting domain-containing protein [Alphaproteobacteria bacterium]|nr:PEP-CTERM sorting domain-containing protein [Alphaproteobacteria bacterium]